MTAVVTAAGCGSRRSTPAPATPPASAPGAPADTRSSVALRLLDTVVIPSKTAPPDGQRARWFGSLSGMARDPRSERYLAVVDDRQPSRVTWLDVRAAGGRITVAPGDVLATRAAAGVDERVVTGADLEAIVALPDGTWIAAEEGHYSLGLAGQPVVGAWQPSLLTLDAALTVTSVIPWPDRFALGAERGGVRDNQGVESLTRTPDGRLIAGLERPLHADLAAPPRNNSPFSGGAAGPGRLVEWIRDGSGWRTSREWVYPLEATPLREGFRDICDDGEIGLAELVALDDERLLALERACLRQGETGPVRNVVRLFLADLSAAEDVAPSTGRAAATARPVRKTLVLDFDTLIPQLPPELANLDNFEAMAFGPATPEGGGSLLVVSDDNFNATQHTVFLWFAIEEGRRD